MITNFTIFANFQFFSALLVNSHKKIESDLAYSSAFAFSRPSCFMQPKFRSTWNSVRYRDSCLVRPTREKWAVEGGEAFKATKLYERYIFIHLNGSESEDL